MSKQSIYANLPKIVKFLGVEDMGDEADARCPHCGAQGRYIYYFECEDGTRRGAMKGCYRHFQRTDLVKTHEKLTEKSEQGGRMPMWDEMTLKALDAFARGEINELTRDARIYSAEMVKKTWQQSRGR